MRPKDPQPPSRQPMPSQPPSRQPTPPPPPSRQPTPQPSRQPAPPPQPQHRHPAPPPPQPPRYPEQHSHHHHHNNQRYDYYGVITPGLLLLPWSGELPDIPGTSVMGRNQAEVEMRLTEKLNEAIERERRFGRMPMQASLHELTHRYPQKRIVQIYPTVRY